ncbi:MAG: acetate/propionate family kinase [Pseudomonadota bacterium]
MKEVILVLNAGSSSIKFCLFQPSGNNAIELDLVLSGHLEGLYGNSQFSVKNELQSEIYTKTWSISESLSHETALKIISEFLEQQRSRFSIKAIGHRVVHGGTYYSDPLIINRENIKVLESLNPLAPLHQPHNISLIKLLMNSYPKIFHIACFDTAFHRTNPLKAQLFALPLAYAEKGIRRYGFHGSSYEYIAEQLPRFSSRASQGKTIVCHLGNGASLCALEKCRSIYSTTGFTAVEGLMMGTRTGSIDPGVILYLLETEKLTARQVEQLIYKESGLLGVSGISNDMRKLLASNKKEAKLAIDMYIFQIQKSIGMLTAILGGLDSIVFTAGIGENSIEIRERVCESCVWLGLEINHHANQASLNTMHSGTSKIEILMIPTHEEYIIAKHTWEKCINA